MNKKQMKIRDNYVKEIKSTRKPAKIIKEIDSKVMKQLVVKEVFFHLRTWNMYHYKAYQIAFFSKKVEQLIHVASDNNLNNIATWLKRERTKWLKHGLRESIKKRKANREEAKKRNRKKRNRKKQSKKSTKKQLKRVLNTLIDEL